jgi:carbon starvation protein
MFGVANQMLAVIALAIISSYLTNVGRARYLWVTVLPMLFVMTTTSTAAVQMFGGQIDAIVQQIRNAPDVRNLKTLFNASVTAGAIAVVVISGYIVIISSAIRIWTSTGGLRSEARGFEPVVT